MTCRAGQSSFVINWQGMIRSCVVLDQPSYDAFDTTHDFMTLWNKIVKETEEMYVTHVQRQRLQNVEILRAFQNIYVNIRRKQLVI